MEIEITISDTVQYASHGLHYNKDNINESVLDADTHVVYNTPEDRNVQHSLWQSISDANNNPDSLVLIVSPTRRQAEQKIKMIEQELDLSMLDMEKHGIEEIGNTDVFFKNGSRIISSGLGLGGERIRGYSPDTLVVNNPYMTGAFESVIDEVIVPMIPWTDRVWVNNADITSTLTRQLASDGVYIEDKR